jgi:lipopolysaccharide export system protein LptC
MMSRIAYAWPFVLMLLLGGLTLWLRQVIDTPGGDATAQRRHDTDGVVENFTVTRLDKNGLREAQISAQRMVHFADGEATELYSPRLEKSGAGVTLRVRAQRGVVSRDYQDARFYDDVELLRQSDSSPDTLQVRTQFLQVLIDAEILRTDRPVVLTQGGSTISGVGMEYDRKTGRLVLLSGVKASFPAKTGQGRS